MREIPMPEWSSRQLSSKSSGPWRLFFVGPEENPVVPVQDVIRTEYLTNPVSNRPVSSVSLTLPRRKFGPPPEPEFVDSYTVFKWRKEREQEQQKMVVRPYSSLSRRTVEEGPRLEYAPQRPWSMGRGRCPVAWHPRFEAKVRGLFREGIG
jgi:hypothetical protein